MIFFITSGPDCSFRNSLSWGSIVYIYLTVLVLRFYGIFISDKLFDYIDWGTSQVFKQQLNQALSVGISPEILPVVLEDVVCTILLIRRLPYFIKVGISRKCMLILYTGLEGIKLFFMLRSVEHDMLNANNYKDVKKFDIF